ncbi:MAG: hypothetical protein COT43_02610 [Candidatus Marinimicrobia bacterium CG08_land_8_20_14_0_20_45_22]|nr:MAG: hypothetical protein COT43_02610 [Candidatus Marinimicrobia bacterium CG08_land_8_20_14_0_20_45_22]
MISPYESFNEHSRIYDKHGDKKAGFRIGRMDSEWKNMKKFAFYEERFKLSISNINIDGERVGKSRKRKYVAGFCDCGVQSAGG